MVELPEVREAIKGVDDVGAIGTVKLPAKLAVFTISVDRAGTKCYERLESLEMVDYVGTVCPWAAEVDVENLEALLAHILKVTNRFRMVETYIAIGLSRKLRVGVTCNYGAKGG